MKEYIIKKENVKKLIAYLKKTQQKPKSNEHK
jgi:hypothetical protein